MTNNEFLTWLEAEYAKHHFTNKEKSINELIYTLRMSGIDFCLSITYEVGACLCVPSVNETFVPSWCLAKKIKTIEYENDDSEYPAIFIETK